MEARDVVLNLLHKNITALRIGPAKEVLIAGKKPGKLDAPKKYIGKRAYVVIVH